MQKQHPCLSCGACCAAFRVSFYWSETQADSFAVPEEMTEKINPHYLAMRGTNSKTPHCAALEGVVGKEVSCRIYNNRSSTCREFQASYENGEKFEACDRARAKYGLEPLSLESWS